MEEPPSPEIQVKHNHLLAIGIDHYADEHIPDLSNCVNDMEDLIAVLLQDYWFDAGNIRLLRSSNGDRDADESIQQAKAEAERLERGLAVLAEATHENIIAQLRELAQKLTPEDNVIVAYSGHGIYDEVFDEGYWMPSDSEEGNNSTYIENSTIRTALNAMKSRHMVLISDSCFSGSLFSSGAQRAVGIPRVLQARLALGAHRRPPQPNGIGRTRGQQPLYQYHPVDPGPQAGDLDRRPVSRAGRKHGGQRRKTNPYG